jgi:hypothetical protein
MKTLLKYNAEFAKNIWLEISPMRLIAMPAVIGLVLLALYINGNDPIYKTVHEVSLGGFVIIGLIWGMKNAADSIINEHNESTWDWQKMSSLGALKLVLGKLFGSTIYNWYGALMCWLLFMLTAGYESYYDYETSESVTRLMHDYTLGVSLLIAMVTLTGLVQLIALQLMRKTSVRAKIKSSQLIIIGVVLLSFTSNIFIEESYSSNKSMFDNWYNLPFNASILTGLFYCIWVVAGLYRSMRTELQFSDVPTWWGTFIITNFLFQLGFFVGVSTEPDSAPFSMCVLFYCVQLVAILYLLAFSEAKSIVNFTTLISTIKTKSYSTFFENTPLWLITLPIVFLFGIIATVLSFNFVELNQAAFTSNSMAFPTDKITLAAANGSLLITVFGFMVRDLGVLLLFNFSPYAKRADVAMLIYMALVYGLLPLLVKGSGLVGLFYPNVEDNMLISVSASVIEALVVLFLLRQRWNELSKAAQ